MSSELYDKFARINRKEIANGAATVGAETVFAELEKKHFG